MWSMDGSCRFSLNECLHISPRLVCQEEDCFEFAVTLKDKVLRLATESRELTLDWVATLTEKLRERGVFQPKENEYTTEPHKGIVPGAGMAANESTAHGSHTNSSSSHTASGNAARRFGPAVSTGSVSGAGGGVAPLPPAHPRRNMPLPPPPTEESEGRCFGGSNASNRSSAGSHYRPPSAAEMRTSLLSMVESSGRFLRQESIESDASSSSSLASFGDREAPVGPTSTTSGVPRDPTSRLPAPPTSPAHDQPIYEPIFPLVDRRLDRHHLSRTESARATPRQRMALQEDRSAKRHSYTGMAGLEDAVNGNTGSVQESRGVLTQHQPRRDGQMDEGRLARADFPRVQAVANPFRCAGMMSAAERVMARDTLYSDPSGHDDNANVNAGVSSGHRPLSGPDASATPTEGPTSLPPVGTPQPPEVPARSRHSIAEPRPLSPKPPRAVLRREATQENMRRMAATGDGLNANSNNPFLQAQPPAERVQVRNSTVVPGPSPLDTANSATHADAPQIAESLYAEISETSTGHVTLREGQILKLQEEMAHQAGILVKFAKRDVQGSLALVDVGGAVYIAGWNKPQMRTDLHIGDRLLNICGRRVICASEANKTIKGLVINRMVELTIQRVPYGKALAMRRNFDGENLGLIMENGTNEIHRVLEGGLAHRSGLPLMVVPTALDGGMTLTTWWITEVNHRPISLFYKNSEIEPRLRAVGKDISLVVQPSDFIRALKKQLKSMWTYKSYIAH
ncbi:hypothetical protein BIW11_02888 [Tropilaelaps mercedesae]|uniref:PH domain-containing protein n=1 Tax=Tropilaelaps mercedesae TaxID=418985 RepID=A0A1V9XVT3_9ACAR|nr:hypothetical protein BIW11_02888 [Tropilaelaps mercedesae]